MANITFNSVDLSSQGLVTPGVAGEHDLAPAEIEQVWIPFRDVPGETTLRRKLMEMTFDCSVVGSSHADLVTKLRSLKKYLSPQLDWCTFAMTDLSDLRTYARCTGLQVQLDSIPYIAEALEFPLTFLRYPYWEDSSLQSVTDDFPLVNDGNLPTFPVYTCTATDTLGSGLYFEVGSERFTYEGALVSTDVVVVYTDLPDVTKNGSRDFPNTKDDAVFPALATDSNTITKSSANFTLKVEYRRRWE